MNAVPDDKV
jgi:hypothetical protein